MAHLWGMKCTVFKFGGASVRDAKRIKNMANILAKQNHKKLVLVVSAMGKNTNLLEQYVQAYRKSKKSLNSNLVEFADKHYEVGRALGLKTKDLEKKYTKLIADCSAILKAHKSTPAFVYDQIVSLGELFSTISVSYTHLTLPTKA